MATNLYINTQLAPEKSLVNSQTNYLALVNPPEFTQGEQRTLFLYFVDGAGAYETWSDDATYSPTVALGLRNEAPTGGTWTISGDGSDLTGTTAQIDYDATAAEVLSALTHATTGLTKVVATGILTSSDVTVTKLKAGHYNIEFKGDLDLQDVGMLTVASEGLTPNSNDTVSEVIAGSATLNEVQSIKLTQAPVAVQTSWSVDGNDYQTATLELNTTGITQLLATQTDGQAEVWLTISMDDASGNTITYVQRPVTLRASAYDEEATQPTPITTATVHNRNFIHARETKQGLVLDGAAGYLTVLRGSANDIGTSDFTLGLTCYLSDFTPASNTVLIDSIDGSTNGIQVSLLTTGVIRLAIGNGTDLTTYQYDSTAPITGGSGMLHLVLQADRSANLNIYQSGTKIGASVDMSGSSAQTATSTINYRIGYDGTNFASATIMDFYLSKAVETAAEILLWAQTGHAPTGYVTWLDIEHYENGYFVFDRSSNNLHCWLTPTGVTALLPGRHFWLETSLSADGFVSLGNADLVTLPANNYISTVFMNNTGTTQSVQLLDDNGGNSLFTESTFTGIVIRDGSDSLIYTNTTNKMYVNLGATQPCTIRIEGYGDPI